MRVSCQASADAAADEQSEEIVRRNIVISYSSARGAFILPVARGVVAAGPLAGF